MGGCAGKKAPQTNEVPPTAITVTGVVKETIKESPAPAVQTVVEVVKPEIVEPKEAEAPIPDHLPDGVKEAAQEQWDKDKSIVALSDTVYTSVRNSLVGDEANVEAPPKHLEQDDEDAMTPIQHDNNIPIPPTGVDDADERMSKENVVELQTKMVTPEESGGCLKLCSAKA